MYIYMYPTSEKIYIKQILADMKGEIDNKMIIEELQYSTFNNGYVIEPEY